MRTIAAVLLLLFGTSVWADPAADVARILVREVNQRAIVDAGLIQSDRLIAELVGNENLAVKTLAKDRVSGLLDAHLRSPDFERNVLIPWLTRTFTTQELTEIAAFAGTSAGRKFLTRSASFSQEMATLSLQHLQGDIAEEVLGSRQKAEEFLERARIKRTYADMRSLATALGAYATDHDRWPNATDMDSLRPAMSPMYIRRMPDRDAWGRPFAYSASADGNDYRLASAGPDGVMNTADDIVFTRAEQKMPEELAPPERMVVTSRVDAPLRVGGDVKAPVLMHRIEPEMTEEAQRARISGIVILEAIIDEQGNVTDARVLKPLPFGLDQAAVEAVRQWKFRPATLGGAPVPVIFNLTVNFRPKESS